VVEEDEAVLLQEELHLEKYLECGVFDSSGTPERTRVVQLFSGLHNHVFWPFIVFL